MSIVDFSDVITFSRSTGGGLFNAAGKYTWVPANEQRIDYDPVTGECRGLLVEEQRTNLLLGSTYGGASGETAPTGWTIGFSTGVTTTQPSKRLIGGTVATQSGTVQREHYSQNVSLVAGTTYTLSAYFNAGTSATENILAVAGLTPGFSGSDRLSGSAFSGEGRYSITFTPVANGLANIRVGLGCLTTATGTVIHELPQLEEGGFPTSYITTTDSQVTRAADVAMVNNLNPWFNAEEGAWKVRAQGIVGRPLITAGSSIITANSSAVKDYTLTYSSDPGAEFMQIGQGHIQKIEYYPNGNAGGGNA